MYTLNSMPIPSIPLILVNGVLNQGWTLAGNVLSFASPPSGPLVAFYLCLGP